MWQLLIMTDAMGPFAGAIEALRADGRCAVRWSGSLQAAVDAVRERRPDLVIVDARVDGQDGVVLCRNLLQVDAFVNLAVVSDLDDDAFHEAFEGLGLLGRLPPNPDPADFKFLLKHLADVSPRP